MSWGPPVRDQQNGILTHYLVTLTSAVGTITRNVSSAQVLVSGLSPYTLYNCTVQAGTIGLGPGAMSIQVNTPQDGNADTQLKIDSSHVVISL